MKFKTRFLFSILAVALLISIAGISVKAQNQNCNGVLLTSGECLEYNRDAGDREPAFDHSPYNVVNVEAFGNSPYEAIVNSAAGNARVETEDIAMSPPFALISVTVNNVGHTVLVKRERNSWRFVCRVAGTFSVAKLQEPECGGVTEQKAQELVASLEQAAHESLQQMQRQERRGDDETE